MATEIREMPSTATVAMLFTTRWLDETASASLRSEGLNVQRFANVLALVEALHLGTADVAVVEDAGEQLHSCLLALRFRGHSTAPVIALGNGSPGEIAAALRSGASDYAVVGEAMQTLVARVVARLRLVRERGQPQSLQLGACELHTASRSLSGPNGETPLTWREFSIAWLLFQHAGQVVNLRTLSTQVWGRDVSVAKRTIEQHMSRLRRKLQAAGCAAGDHLRLQAVHNVGYRLALEPRSRAQAPMISPPLAHAAGRGKITRLD
jgi:DNA-binding response OmpR family regulator